MTRYRTVTSITDTESGKLVAPATSACLLRVGAGAGAAAAV